MTSDAARALADEYDTPEPPDRYITGGAFVLDEPAAGLSPVERRELVLLLRSLPAHMSYVLFEHDLDIALRVVERVTSALGMCTSNTPLV